MIGNLHGRVLDAPPTEIGTLIDGLAGAAPRYAVNRPLRLHGSIVVKPAIAGLDGDRACFVDGSEEPVERIIVVRGVRLTSIWDYARRPDGYAAGLAA